MELLLHVSHNVNKRRCVVLYCLSLTNSFFPIQLKIIQQTAQHSLVRSLNDVNPRKKMNI